MNSSKPGKIIDGLVQLLPDEWDRSYKPSASFVYGGLITQIALPGDIAIRNKGKVLHNDAKAGKFTNSDAANRAFRGYARPGWTLPT